MDSTTTTASVPAAPALQLAAYEEMTTRRETLDPVERRGLDGALRAVQQEVQSLEAALARTPSDERTQSALGQAQATREHVRDQLGLPLGTSVTPADLEAARDAVAGARLEVERIGRVREELGAPAPVPLESPAVQQLAIAETHERRVLETLGAQEAPEHERRSDPAERAVAHEQAAESAEASEEDDADEAEISEPEKTRTAGEEHAAPGDRPEAPEPELVIESNTRSEPHVKNAPGLRAKVLENGDVSYAFKDLASRATGREAFCDEGPRITLGDTSDRAIRAAVSHAKEKWGDAPVTLRVEPELRERVSRAAVRAGLNVTNPELQPTIERARETQERGVGRASGSGPGRGAERSPEREAAPSRGR